MPELLVRDLDAATGVALLAPDLIWSEVANALWRKWRDKELKAEVVKGILA